MWFSYFNKYGVFSNSFDTYWTKAEDITVTSEAIRQYMDPLQKSIAANAITVTCPFNICCLS